LHKKFNALAERVLSPAGNDVINAVTSFYDKTATPQGAQAVLRQDERIIKDVLSTLSDVKSVYGVGNFYAGMYDPIPLRFVSLVDCSEGRFEEAEFLARDIPDRDFMIVFKDGTDRWPVSESMDLAFRKKLLATVESDPEWLSAGETLATDHGVCRISLLYDKRLHHRDVGMFSEGLMRLSLSPSVPENAWPKIPFLSKPGDLSLLYGVRDLLVTPQFLWGRPSSVPTEFRLNYLLHAVSEGAGEFNLLLGTVFGEINEGIKSKPPIELCPKARDHVIGNWMETIKNARAGGFLGGKGEKLSLTQPGSERLAQVSSERDRILHGGTLS